MASGTSHIRPSDLSQFIHRELVLLFVLASLAAVGFILTRAAATNSRAQQSVDAAAWYERGRTRLADGRSADAVTALRRAVAGDRDDWRYASTLAEALVADGQMDAARQVLLLWRLRQPEDGDVNTQLARLEATVGNLTTAVEYYESALYGRWPTTASNARIELRRELIRYLLRHDEQALALSQVLILSANQPDESAAHIQTARLFLAAGDPARALETFQRALRLDPASPEGRAGAGESAFALGDYTRALTYLSALTDERSRGIARTAAAVLASDPLQPRLPFAERRRRMTNAVGYAGQRLAACRPASPSEDSSRDRTLSALAASVAAFRSELSPRRLRESPDVIDQGLRLVYQAIESVGEFCPPPGERDDVLRRVARRHGATEP